MNSFDKKVLDRVAKEKFNIVQELIKSIRIGNDKKAKKLLVIIAETSRLQALGIVEEIKDKHINDTIASGDPCDCIIEGAEPCDVLNALFEIKKRFGGDGE